MRLFAPRRAREAAGEPAQAVGSTSPAAAPGSRRSRGRRWAVLVLLAAVAGAGLLAICLPSRPGFRARAVSAVDAAPHMAPILLDAEQVVNRLLDDFPLSPHALEVLVLFQLRFGTPEEAVATCRRCLELDQDFSPAYYWLGTLAAQRGEHAEAAAALRNAARLDPESVDVVMQLAQSLMQLGAAGEAIAVLEESLEVDAKFVPNLVFLGEAYLQQKEYEKAREVLERAVRLGPDLTNAYYLLTTACAKLGDQARAEEWRKRFRELRERDTQAHRDYLNTFDDAAEARAKVAEVYAAASRVYLLYNQAEEAEELLLRARRLEPAHLKSGQALARLYELQGRTEEALRISRELAERAPKDLGAQVEFGLLCARQGRFDEAEEALGKALRLAPQRDESYAALAGLYLQSKRKPLEAKVLALRAADLEPSARNYNLLSGACHRSGDAPGARSAIDRAVALDPDNAEYRQAQAVVYQGTGR